MQRDQDFLGGRSGAWQQHFGPLVSSSDMSCQTGEKRTAIVKTGETDTFNHLHLSYGYNEKGAKPKINMLVKTQRLVH